MERLDYLFIFTSLAIAYVIEFISFNIGVPTSTFFYAAGIFFSLFLIYRFDVLIFILVHRIVAFYLIYDIRLHPFMVIVLGFISITLYYLLAEIWKPFIFRSSPNAIVWKRGILSGVLTLVFSLIWVMLSNLDYSRGDIFLSTIFGMLARVFGIVIVTPVLLTIYNTLFEGEMHLDMPSVDKLLTSTGASIVDNKLKLLTIALTILVTITSILFLNTNPHFTLLFLIPLVFVALQSDLRDMVYINGSTSVIMFLIFVILKPQLPISSRLEMLFYLTIFYTMTFIIAINYTSSKLDQISKEQTEQQLFHMQKSQTIERMAGGTAHEINNYMQIISGYVEILENSNLDETQKQHLKKIKETMQRTTKLMSQMLLISRRTIPQRVDMSVSDLINENREIYKLMTGDNFRLIYDLQEVSPTSLDPNQINQILINLLSNSKDEMRDGGEIRIECSEVEFEDHLNGSIYTIPQGHYIQFSVEDRGPGIKKERISQIFEPFYTTKPIGDGTGLGLSIVESIVLNHKGYIDVTSAMGMGTKFTVYLPVVTLGPENPKGSQIPEVDFDYLDQIGTIVIIDDEKELVEVIASILAKYGIAIQKFSQPVDVIDYLKNKGEVEIDLIVSDILMRDMDGFKLRNSLAELGFDIPFLFISGYPDDIVDDLMDMGSTGTYLRKPFTRNALLQAIKEATFFKETAG